MPSVLSIDETFQQRTMRAATDRSRDYVRTFNVVVDDRTIAPDQILLATAIPRRWSFYVSASGTVDLYSICKEVEVKQDTGDPYLWRVTARYSNKVERPDINEIENPLLRPAEISYDMVEVPRQALFDIDGAPIQNSARERFDPPIEYTETRLSLIVTRNLPTYDAMYYLRFRDSVNATPWFGLPRGVARCVRIKGQRKFESGFFHWPTTFEFHLRVQLDTSVDDLSNPEVTRYAWAQRVLDRGYMILDGSGNAVHARDTFSKPFATPQLLDGSGHLLTPGSDPVFLQFRIYPEREFNELPLF